MATYNRKASWITMTVLKNCNRSLCITTFLALAALSAAQSTTSETRFLSQARQLIYEGKRSGEGYFSADGKKMIYQSEREDNNPFYQMYVLDFDTGESTLVSPGTGKTTCGYIHPSGSEVLFASTHLDADATSKQQAELDFRASGKERRYSWDYDEAMDIFSAGIDGNNQKRLTDAPGYDAEGSYSPDGKKIVFSSLRSAFPLDGLSAADRKLYDVDPAFYGEIYIMNADGSDQKRLTSTPGYDGGPFFSPNGERIIWRRFDKSGMIADVYTMKIDGSDVKKITDFGAMSWAPFYHPSGEYIVFTTNKFGFGNFELFIVDAAGSKEPVRVTYTPRFDGLPVFTPDGKSLAWSTGRTDGGNSQIYMAKWNHDAALKALDEAPARTASSDKETTGTAAGH